MGERQEPGKCKHNASCELHSAYKPGSGAPGVGALCFKEFLAISAGSFHEGVLNGATMPSCMCVLAVGAQ